MSYYLSKQYLKKTFSVYIENAKLWGYCGAVDPSASQNLL